MAVTPPCLWAASWAGLFASGFPGTILVVAYHLIIIAVLNYTISLIRYHRAQKAVTQGDCRLPPHYPSFIPYFGPLFQLWWNHGKFMRGLSSYRGRLTSNRVTLMGQTYYSFQEPDTIEKLFKQSTLSSSIDMYGFVNSYLLGTSKTTMALYKADNSGPFPQPHPNSNVLPHNRIDWITHHSTSRGLVGPGLQPTTSRFAKELRRRLQDLSITEEWTEMSDFAQFYREIIGASALQSIVGPTMLRLHPTFVKDIFKFDSIFPTFALGLPYFMMPKSYRFRDSLVAQFKNWYRFAREHFDPSHIYDDGDGDPYWGSAMMRDRQNSILGIDGHDDEALARVDLGLIWATIGNVVLSAMFSAFHIFKDTDLLDRVRQDLHKYLGQSNVFDADPPRLAKEMPLLSSIYAETLRLYIKVYSVYSSPHEDVELGKWRLPKGALAILNSEPSHMNSNFWNTKNGEHPVESFWSDRFLVDPSDPDSGPVSPSLRKPSTKLDKQTGKGPIFSTEGCEGAWIPYGGGYSMCPGRFLARNIIILTSAVITSEYDVELGDSSPEFTRKRYGMGVEDLKKALPFRIRKRASAQE
ncbi:hypothetical protein NUW58_g1007 [Xylaria curta]|uniref:Uncharacterized protein n=1 Tax=Xylaria curta TaxID=42375 RepID=A0ACC1PNX7_9PEZI|nr:hypothetical protein NUW58_g1007 [Xylaria curta]